MTLLPSHPPLTFALPDASDSDALGRMLAAMVGDGFGAAQGPDFDGFTIHFSGELGAGKTTVVRALLRALGVEGRIKSPTYTLVEPYVIKMPKSVESRLDMNLYCYHFDFYRFEDPQEWLEAGFRDYFSDAVLRLVEWPERARSEDGSFVPSPDLHVTIEVAGEGRVATLDTHTAAGATWLSRTGLRNLPPSAAGES